MRRLLLFALVVALAVPPLFGNVIVKRQADDEESAPAFANDEFLTTAPFDRPQDLLNTVGGLVRGVFDVVRRLAGTARDVSEPIIETLELIQEVNARNPIVETLAQGQRRIDEDFREDAPKVAALGEPLRGIMETAFCDFLCPGPAGQLFSLPCRVHDCPQIGGGNFLGDLIGGKKPADDDEEEDENKGGDDRDNAPLRVVEEENEAIVTDAGDESDFSAAFENVLQEAMASTPASTTTTTQDEEV